MNADPMTSSGGPLEFSAVPVPQETELVARELGRYGSGNGPTLVCVAGLHGNEPSGVSAVQRVLSSLRRHQPTFHGRFIALAGNLPALREGRRFLTSDLNRGWHSRRVSRLRERSRAGAAFQNEDNEVVELIEAIEDAFLDASHELYVVDLHTTSSVSAPFVTIGDTLRNRAFARILPVPFVLGIEEQINAPMLEYLSERGAVTMGVEAGQHDSALSIDRHEWALWAVLQRLGCLNPAAVPEATGSLRQLRESTRGLSRAFEVTHRHEVIPGDGFVMRPGYRNFQKVRHGEVVADDRTGEISVPEDGYLFLPLYQAMGDDGLFIVQPVAPAWLRLSWILRRLRVSEIVHWLPGVHRLPERPNTMFVSRKIARWFAVQVFHLLGYRRDRTSDEYYVFGRRSYDIDVPDELEPV
ncbi:MAG: succinylglutamate desuccinylase/aspartoacylase family protein [Gemmatimonadota bacterium]